MGVSFSSAFRSPSLQARSSVLTSFTPGSLDCSLGCAGSCIASLNYTADDPCAAPSAPITSGGTKCMKNILTSIAASTLLAALATAQPSHPSYRVSDLGPVGSPFSQATSLNNHGLIGGVAVIPDGT